MFEGPLQDLIDLEVNELSTTSHNDLNQAIASGSLNLRGEDFFLCLLQLSLKRASLEDAFMQMTGEDVQYHASTPGAPATNQNIAPYSQWQNLTFDPPMVMFSANQYPDGRRADMVDHAA